MKGGSENSCANSAQNGDSGPNLEQAASQPEIKHVVALMMENQSFDRVLGFVPGVGRLQGDEWALNKQGHKVTVTKGAHPVLHHAFDPPHGFADICAQHYDKGASLTNPDSFPTGACQLSSVNFGAGSDAEILEKEQDFMRCFDHDGTATAALATLAQKFVTCDRWFASVPGATGPNRLFFHCASSGGYAGDGYLAKHLSVPPEMDNVFECLDRAGKSWGLYYDGGRKGNLATAMAIPHVAAHSATNVKDLNAFYTACCNDSLPSYSFLSGDIWKTSQHPGAKAAAANGMVGGDDLIADVYEAIRSNKAVWEKTLLIITYDEAGGYWDSVTPGSVLVPAPGPLPEDVRVQNKSGAKFPDYHFQHVGVRVPTLLVSPWLDPSVNHDVYDHASMPALLKGIFDFTSRAGPEGFLSQRDKSAKNPWTSLKFRTTPRDDVSVLPRSSFRGARVAQSKSIGPEAEAKKQDAIMGSSGDSASERAATPVLVKVDAKVELNSLTSLDRNSAGDDLLGTNKETNQMVVKKLKVTEEPTPLSSFTV